MLGRLALWGVQTRFLSAARILHAARPQKVAAAASSGPASATVLATKGLKRYGPQYITYKPITPGIRHLRRPINSHLYEGRPLLPLTHAMRKRGGRNTTHGRITVRFRGGGHRRRIRHVDFKRISMDPHEVIRIEYDPGRSAHIALLRRKPKEPLQQDTKDVLYSYILAPDGLKAGDVVQSFRTGIPKDLIPGYHEMLASSEKEETAASEEVPPDPDATAWPLDSAALAEPKDNAAAASSSGSTSQSAVASLALAMFRAATVKAGNVLLLHMIPTGTTIHNISLDPNGPGILVRSAGSQGLLVAHEPNGKYSHVQLQSGEVRRVLSTCCATVGKVSNPLHQFRSLGKAGRRRWLGFRPRVRGMAMNAVDHPHGGGRGKSKGNKHPRSVWGWLTKGKRTRKPGPKGPPGGNKMVIRERPRGKDKVKAV